jgi:hypothetical protein
MAGRGGAAGGSVHATDLVGAEAGQRSAVASGDQAVTQERFRVGKLSTGPVAPL